MAFIVLAAILKRLVFEVAKLSRDVREMRRHMDYPSIPAANVQDVVPVPELVDGPLDDLSDDLVTLLRQKTAQTYVVSITISLCIHENSVHCAVCCTLNKYVTCQPFHTC